MKDKCIELQEIANSLDIKFTQKSIKITKMNTLLDATSEHLSFIDSKKYIDDLKNTKAGAVFVDESLLGFVPKNTIALTTNTPYIDMAKISKMFAPKYIETNGADAVIGKNCTIMQGAYLGKNVVIGDDCIIMANSFIGDNVTIKNNTVIYANVTIYRDCCVGSDCIIHSGTVIGSDGFGFAITKNGEYIKIYQNGNVQIGNNVEIGSNCSIDRAAFLSTIIGNNSRIDNLVHIAHNCIIGDGSILAGQIGLAGSTILGEHVVMGGQAGATGHLSIAPFTQIAGRGVATKTISKKGNYAGFPLLEHKTWLKLQAKIQKLLKS